MSDKAIFHAAFEGDVSVTITIDYSRLKKGKGVTEILEYQWEGKPNAAMFPQYVAWMHTVMCEVAQRTQQKILYAYPGKGHGPQMFEYLPDGSYKACTV